MNLSHTASNILCASYYAVKENNMTSFYPRRERFGRKLSTTLKKSRLGKQKFKRKILETQY